MKYRVVNILLALGCKTTVDALAYDAGVAAEIDLKLKLEQVFDRWVGKEGTMFLHKYFNL